MFTLVKDCLDRGQLFNKLDDSPDEKALRDALRALDSSRHTQLWLLHNTGCRLLVTGPASERYAMDYDEPNGAYRYAVDSHAPQGSLTFSAGREAVEIPARQTISREVAETLLLDFLRQGSSQLDDNWEVPPEAE